MISIGQLGLSVVAGSLTTLSPCVFPILPLVIGGASQKNKLAPLAMGLGMVSSFALIGVLLGLLGPALGIDGDTVRTAGAILLTCFGLTMVIPFLNERFTALLTPLANSANSATSRLDTGSLWGSLALGGLLGLVWSPCSGPLLASALTLVASEGGGLQGGLILGLFGAGAAIPLVVVAYASRSGFNSMRAVVVARMDGFKRIFGILLILLGLAILSGADKWLESHLVSFLPDWWIGLSAKF